MHFQVPFHDVGGGSLLNKIKLDRIDNVVCNSGFTKKFIDAEYGVNSKVIFPPVDVESFKPGKKENIILSAGRFSKLLQAKRQDILIETFKNMVDKGFSGWRLALAGSTDVGGQEYVNQLRKSAKSYPIDFFESCSFEVLKDLYARSKLFWYAGGYGIDEELEPEKTEHFGMTIVEAMAAGCIPIVVGRGGISEIINDGKNGFFWENPKDLSGTTLRLIETKELIENVSKNAVSSSRGFSAERFCEEFDKIIQ